MKILMTQYSPYCYQWLFLFLTMVTISPFLSSSSLSPLFPSAKKEVIMTCAIKYNYYRHDYYINFDLINKVSLNTSQWEFGIESCYPNVENVFCEKKWVIEKRYNVCNRVNTSDSVLCVLRIDPDDLVQNSYRYRFYAKYNSTYYLNKTIIRLSSLNCECKDFYFDPNLNISIFPLLGKAEVNIKPFLEPTFHISGFDMAITPNKSLVIKKDSNNFQYQLSKLDQCQNYSLEIALELAGTTFKRKCKNNWKMNNGIIKFQNPELDVNEISCSHNLTHINLISTYSLDSNFYYKLTIRDLQFTRNFTNNMSFSFPKMKNIISDNQTGFINLCYSNCEKCSIKHPVMCYSDIQRAVARENNPNKKSDFLSVELISSIIAVVLFAIVLTYMWRRYCCRKREGMIPSFEPIAPRPSDPTSNLPLNQFEQMNDSVEPVYEQIEECHIYDKCDVKLDHSSAVSAVSDRNEFLYEEDKHCEEMSNFLSYK